MTTLLLSARHTDDDQALWRAAIGRDWSVVRVRGIRIPEIQDSEIVIYVEALYAPTIASTLGLHLLDPPDDWLVRLPSAYRKRHVRIAMLGEAWRLNYPAFVKPPNDKSFQASVYASGAELPREFDPAMTVLVAEPVHWELEFRCFMLDGEVRTLSPYLRNGVHAKLSEYEAHVDELDQARQFAEVVAADTSASLPRAVALDVGVIAGRGWAVVEANGAWGSGIYGCDPDAVLDVIRCATIKVNGKTD